MTPNTPTPCPLCGASHADTLLYIPTMPFSMNLAFPSIEAAQTVPRGDLRLAQCRGCGFVYNASYATVAAHHFGPRYKSTQAHSPAWRRERARVLDALLKLRQPRRIMEIGCGDGWVVGELTRRGVEAHGMDPCYTGDDPRIEARRFGPGEHLDADLIYLQHVLDEVPAPRTFLTWAHQATPKAHVFIDVLDAREILERGHVWDLAYERCNYFTPQTLASVLNQPITVEPTPGFLRVVAAPGVGFRAPITTADRDRPQTTAPTNFRLPEETATQIGERLKEALERLRAVVARDAPVVLWGASNKGGNIANWGDPDRIHVRALVDLNPAKQGLFLPGSGHPIVSPTWLNHAPPGAILVVNGRYLDEISQMAPAGWQVKSFETQWQTLTNPG